MDYGRRNGMFHNHLAARTPTRLSPFRDTSVSNREDSPADLAPSRYLLAMVDFPDEEWTDDDIEEEFPLGDGTAETEAIVMCPHCGEANEVALDPGSGSDQEYVEDCQVCCRPWLMYVRYDRDGMAEVEVYASDS
jgi:hypothetical protein